MSKVFDIAFELGAELTSSFRGAFKDAGGMMKTLGGAVAALGGISALTNVAGQVDQIKESMNLLGAQTGLTGNELKELQDVASNVFKGNYGESFEEVSAAVSNVKQNIHNLDNGELQRVTGDAIMLSKTFDSDINEVTRAANNMMKGFGIESSKAMDLFAAGAQRGLNFSDEMFDNVSEYAPLFAKMGYSAEEYFGIMERGAKAGVYNLDYVNDVMKEFQIRTKDGSKSTSEAMGMLSKSTQNVWKDFLKGKGTVSDVATSVVGELKNMDDQVMANQIGVGLFGVKWEDLEADAMYAMLGTTEAMTGFEGKMQAINKIRFDTPLKAIQGIGRTLLMDFVMPISNLALPHLNTFANLLSNNLSPAIDRAISTIKILTPVIMGVVSAISVYKGAMMGITTYQKTFNAVQKITPVLLHANKTAMLAYTFAGGGVKGVLAAITSGMRALNLTMLANPFVLTAAAITGVGVALYTAYKKSETFRNAVNNAFASVGKAVASTVNYIKIVVPTMWNGMIDGIKGIGDKIAQTLGSEITSKISNIVSKVSEHFKTAFSSLPNAIATIGPIVAKMGIAFLGVTGPVGFVIGAVLSLVGYIYKLSQTNSEVAASLTSAWNSIKTAFAPVLEVFIESIQQIASEVGPQLTQTMAVISESIVALGPSFAQLGATFVELGTTLLPVLVQGFQIALPLISSIVSTVVPMIVQMIASIAPIITMIVQTVLPILLIAIQTIFPIILQIVQSVLPIVATLFGAVLGVILEIAQVVLPLIMTVVQTVFPIILAVIQAVMPIITAILQTIVPIITGIIIPALNSILTVVQIVFPFIQMIIQNALAVINGILQAAMALLKGDWEGAWNAIKGIGETIMNNIINFFKGINLFEVGKSIIKGLINGIKSMGSAVIGAIVDMIPAPIRDAASDLLGGLPGFAKGGIITSPTLAWVGEGGDTETVIPWNNSERSKNLWLQTGQALGMLDSVNRNNEQPLDIKPSSIRPGGSGKGGQTTIHLQYSPQYHINGGDTNEVRQVVESGNDDLLSLLKEIQNDEKRLGFN